MSWQLGSFAVLTVALCGGFAWYERARPDTRVIALVATLAGLAALGRIAFAALPNVKPTTDIVLIAGYALGPGPGFAVGALAGLTSNFFFGQGPWTPWQMAGWGATGLIGATLAVAGGGRRRRRAPNRWVLAGTCAVVGFAFTALQDAGDWVTYSDHSSAQLAVYVGRGVGFDAVHAAGCLAFALAFGPALARSVARFASRLEVRWVPASHVVPLLAVGLLIGGWAAGSVTGPASAAPGLQATVSYLLRAQNPDGGFGPAPGQASEPLYSGWAALGLASAGVDPSHVSRDGHTLTGYLEGAGAGQDPGSMERTVLALRAAGAPAGSGVAALRSRIRPDGSVSAQVNLTAFAVLALRAANASVPPATISWLLRQQDSDGGFNFATRGGASDVDDTGAALEALAGVPGAQAQRVRVKATSFIEAHQNRDGGMPSDPGEGSNAQSTAWAVQGLLAADAGGGAVARALAYLNGLLAADGHIRYARGADQTPVWVTAEALMALERKPLPLAGGAAHSKTAHHGGVVRQGAVAGQGGVAGRDGRRASSSARGRPGAPAGRLARAAPGAGAGPATTLAVDLGALSALALAPLDL